MHYDLFGFDEDEEIQQDNSEEVEKQEEQNIEGLEVLIESLGSKIKLYSIILTSGLVLFVTTLLFENNLIISIGVLFTNILQKFFGFTIGITLIIFFYLQIKIQALKEQIIYN